VAIIALTPAEAQARGLVPRAGDWEGVGAHRLPLSFELVRQNGRLAATSIALGAPSSCPADERDAEAVSLFDVTYAGPGGPPVSGGSSWGSAVLSGRVPGDSTIASLTGRFASPRNGTFSIQVAGKARCGWPAGTLAWHVHPATRRPVADGTWSAALSGPGIARGKLRLVVAGQGRVINSISGSFRCQTANRARENRLTVSPAYEFIRAAGNFYSPRGMATTWSGWFARGGALSGTLTTYDACTKHLVRARFAGGPERARHDAVTKPGPPRARRGQPRGPRH
jgi:hypothetical protein